MRFTLSFETIRDLLHDRCIDVLQVHTPHTRDDLAQSFFSLFG